MFIVTCRNELQLTCLQLVESVISDLGKEHRDNFHVVRLNGFIHTDDKLALKETWRQLGREMELEDDVTGKVRYNPAVIHTLLTTTDEQLLRYIGIIVGPLIPSLRDIPFRARADRQVRDIHSG